MKIVKKYSNERLSKKRFLKKRKGHTHFEKLQLRRRACSECRSGRFNRSIHQLRQRVVKYSVLMETLETVGRRRFHIAIRALC